VAAAKAAANPGAGIGSKIMGALSKAATPTMKKGGKVAAKKKKYV
jgi:hypothetical protein